MATQDTSDSFESQVNNLVSTVTRDDAGKIQFPEGTSEALAFAARTEIRRRDTQSSLSQSKAEAARLKAENDQLATSWEADLLDTMTADEQSRLEELKHQDPDKWHAELTALKDSKKTTFQARRQEISTKATQVSETASRQEILAAYEEKYPGVLTDDHLNNDVPPRLVRQLEEGAVTYKQFLDNCVKYLTSNKAILQPDTPPKVPDLSGEPGSGSPSPEAGKNQDVIEYRSTNW